jgi:hypothetical protein
MGAMDIRKDVLACASLALCAACGGGSTTFATGSATLTGTIGGQPMTGRDAVSAIVGAGTAQSAALIVLTNAANQCSLFTNHQAVRNGQLIAIGVGTQSGTQSGTTSIPPVVGSYPVYTSTGSATASGPVAVAVFSTTDASCHSTTPFPPEGTTGHVDITSVAASGYVGTVDITFSNGEHVTGNFNAANCAALNNLTPSTSCP